MLGAVAGDIIGSVYEGSLPQAKTFPLFHEQSGFTDDTVLSIAVADAICSGSDYRSTLHRWGRQYPDAGYGGLFHRWLSQDDPRPYNSYGNGSAMRASPIGWAFDDLDTVMREALRSAEVTHDHPEGIRGAQAVAAAVLLARTGQGKDAIRAMLCERFAYDCSVGLDALRSRAAFDVTCQGTVPAAAAAFLESSDFEDAVRNAVSLGGDADTLACISGALAEAHYGGVPAHIQHEVLPRLDDNLRASLLKFAGRYGVPLATDLAQG